MDLDTKRLQTSPEQETSKGLVYVKHDCAERERTCEAQAERTQHNNATAKLVREGGGSQEMNSVCHMVWHILMGSQ